MRTTGDSICRLHAIFADGWVCSWFWSANFLAGVGIRGGKLLLFWWAVEDTANRQSYFSFLCIFQHFFVGNVSRGSAVSVAANKRVPQIADIERTPKLQTNICDQFASTTEMETRRKWALLFYGFSGITLLGCKVDGDSSRTNLAERLQLLHAATGALAG